MFNLNVEDIGYFIGMGFAFGFGIVFLVSLVSLLISGCLKLLRIAEK